MAVTRASVKNIVILQMGGMGLFRLLLNIRPSSGAQENYSFKSWRLVCHCNCHAGHTARDAFFCDLAKIAILERCNIRSRGG